MNRAGLIGFLLVAVLVAAGVLWWTDPSDRALEQIESGLRQKEPDRGPADAIVERELLDETPEAERVQIPTSTELEARPAGEPVSRVTGVVVGDTDVFPTADRSGVTVYCWPGWFGLAPAKVDSLDQLKDLQVTTTDAQGRFAFDLYVDDAHWVYAVHDATSSDPKGMRIGTKPGIQLTLEMRRLVGSSYRLEDPFDPRPIDAVSQIKVGMLDISRAKIFDAESFPWAFFPRMRSPKENSASLRHGLMVAWLPASALPPFTARLRAEIPGYLPVDALFPAPLLAIDDELPLAIIPIEANASFGEVVIEATGLPDGISFPFSESLSWRLVDEENKQRVPIELTSLLDFPLRRIRVPVGNYRLDCYEHSKVRPDLTGGARVEVRADASTLVTTDWSSLNFWVFQRDPALEDLRFLTPPRIRVPNHEEPGFPDWTEPSQLVVLYPHGEETPISITGDVFLDGPRGPRTEGRVTYYTAGIDDD